MSFCSLRKQITPKHVWFYLVLINSTVLNLLCVWILPRDLVYTCLAGLMYTGPICLSPFLVAYHEPLLPFRVHVRVQQSAGARTDNLFSGNQPIYTPFLIWLLTFFLTEGLTKGKASLMCSPVTTQSYLSGSSFHLASFAISSKVKSLAWDTRFSKSAPLLKEEEQMLDTKDVVNSSMQDHT